jgi:hypothetical protein
MRNRCLVLRSGRIVQKEAIKFDAICGYTFGYRHQFGFFTLNYPKLLSSMYLGVSEITLNYAYLS